MTSLFRAPNKKQRGVALIIVLLIVALVAILATQMTARLQLNIARTLNIKENNQAYWYALGAEHFAKKSLRTLVNMSADNINLNQEWAKSFEYPIEGGVISAQLTDLQSCLNLNGVVPDPNQNTNASGNASQTNSQPSQATQSNSSNPNDKPEEIIVFESFLDNFIDDSLVKETVRDSLVDWLDEDDRPVGYGAEDIDYESLPQPYLAANGMMANISELRLVNGISEGVKQGWLRNLLRHVCVIPEKGFKLNVNTIRSEDAVVLAAMTGLSVDDAFQLIESRPLEGYEDANDFLEQPEISALGMSANRNQWFDVSTKYFKLSTLTTMTSGSQFRMVTVFNINSSDNSIKIVGREFGGI